MAAKEEKSQSANQDEQYKREIKEHLTSLINRIPIGVYLFVSSPDGSMRFDFVSPKFCEIYNIAEEEFMRDPSVAFTSTHPDDHESLVAANKQAVESGEVFFWEGRFVVDGKIKWIEVNSEPNQLSNGDILWSGLMKDISDRKQAEESLASSRDLMRHIIEHSNSAVAVHDRDLKYIYVSERYLQEFKVKERDIIGMHHYEIFPDLPQKWKNVHQRALAGEVLSATEDSYERKDGTVDWTRWECRPWYESNGSIGGIIVYTEIITERKRLEEERKREKDFSDSLVDTAQMIVLVLNPNATVRFINPYMERLSGYKLAEVKDRDWFNTFLPTGDWSEIRELFKEAITDVNTKGHINPIITKDGRERIIEWHDQTLRDNSNQNIGLLAIGQDITERRDVEIKLKQSEERYKIAQAVGHIGIWDWNVITDELIWSDETYHIFGLSPGECVPSVELFMNFVHVDDREHVSHAIEASLNNNQPYNIDCRIIRNDGSESVANAQGEVLFDQDAKPVQMRGTFQDISERKQLEEQLVQSQKMEAIGTLVGGIAHDFNNMLAGMTGNLYLAKERINEMPDVVKNLDNVENIAFRAADMIKQLLTFARKSRMSIKQMSLNSFIKETLKLLRTSLPENIELHQEICSEVLQINGDSTQLHQALLNLINNARDAVEGMDNPAITIRLEAWHPDEAFIDHHSYVENKPYAHLSVEDNGYGIPENQIEHLFEPFFTTKEQGKGTGLGLSMLFGAIKTHDGFVEVDSIEGKGSTFHLYIPLLLQSEELVITASKEKTIARGHGEMILLVDDELPIIETGKAVLESLGYRVLTASDGQQAVDIFEAHADEIELCILDIVMPIMSGDKAAQHIRQIKPDAKIIFATGYDKSILISMENEIVFSKPFHIKEMSSLIRKQLDS